VRARVALAAVLAVATVTVLAGRGSRNESQPDVTGHPCDRVTTAALQSLVKAAVTVERRSVANRGELCEWTYPLPGVAPRPTDPRTIGTIEIGVWRGRRYYAPDAVPEQFTAVPAVADTAHYGPTFLTLRKGEIVMVIRSRIGFEPFRTDAELDLWHRLAALAASRY